MSLSNGTACKRMLVRAFGINSKTKQIAYAENRNFNEEGCTEEAGKCGCMHAEINLLKKMERPEVVIVSHSPCLNCAKELVKARVELVCYLEEYRIKDGIEYLKENEIEVRKLSLEAFT